MDAPRFARFNPHPALAPYVECYWMLHIPAGQMREAQFMPADGRVEVMFSFASGSRRTAADGSDICDVRSRSYLLGARGQGYVFEHSEAITYVAVRFRPGGIGAFARAPMQETADIYVDLDCLWDASTARRLEDALEAAESPRAQTTILNAALLSRLNVPDHLNRLLHAVHRLETASPLLTMPMLADEINLSQKHFERLFLRYLGFRPSLFARIARFQRVMYTVLSPNNPVRWSELALMAGYYDQAHFSKDFKRFSGSTPTDFLTAPHAFIRIATPSQVVELLQDTQPSPS